MSAMNGVLHLPAFIAAAATTIALPGPATLLVATRAAASRRRAAVAVAGIVAGDILAITLAGLGLASAMARVPGLVPALRVAGAAWIAWLGVAMLRETSASEPAATDAASSIRPVVSARREFPGALGMTLCNPKAILFFAAFFPLFVAPTAAAPLAAFARLGAIFEAINLAWFAAVVAIAGRVGGARGRFGALPARIGGAGLLACAALVMVA